MTRRRKIIIGAVIAVLVIAAVILFLLYRGIGLGIGSGDDVIYVQKVSDLGNYEIAVDRFSGVIESQNAENYKRDPERKVEEVYVKVGDTVAVGTPLFKYDVRTSENNIASIKLEIEGLNNEISYLQSQGSSTEVQLQISERQLEIRQKQADLNRYQQEIDQAEVKSTIAGVVKAVSETGEDANGQETPIVTITETGEFRVKGKVSEQSIGTLTSGMPVIVRSRVDEKETWTGKISKIETEPGTNNNQENSYDSGSAERSTSYPFYVSLDSTAGLMLGQHVFIEPDYGQSDYVPKEGIWIDQSFIAYEDNGNTYVWVSRNGRLDKRSVELGQTDDDFYSVEIVSGLESDDLIAWPDETLREGQKAVDISEAE